MIISFSDVDTNGGFRISKRTGYLALGGRGESAQATISLLWLTLDTQHDKIGVEEASVEISNLMRAKPHVSGPYGKRIVAEGMQSSGTIGHWSALARPALHASA